MKKSLPLITSILVCLLAGFIGSYFTMPAIPVWYQGLTKPSFNPPAFVFGPVWTLLYIMMGIAAGMIWNKGVKQKGVKLKKIRAALMAFCVQLALNTLWSIAFFGFRSPLFGVVIIVFLWLSIVETIRRFRPISTSAAWLLAPYICWVSFAAALNVSVWFLNR